MYPIWNDLIEFETRDLVERFVKQKHNRSANVTRINEITSNFIQGREYFQSATQAGATVKPLLLYYGVLALSRGLILALIPKLSEASLKQSHGLDIRNWSDVLASKDFENLKLTITDGTFLQLVRATENRNYLRAGTNWVTMNPTLPYPKIGDTALLKNIVQFFPDLRNEYKLWTESDFIYGTYHRINYHEKHQCIRLTSYPKLNEAALELIFPSKYCTDKEYFIKDMHTTIKYSNLTWFPNVTQVWNNGFNHSDICVIPVLSNNIGFNILSGMYAIAYTFGMMARYFPTIWMGLRRRERGDRVYPLVHSALRFIEERFPIVILDYLRAPYDLLDEERQFRQAPIE